MSEIARHRGPEDSAITYFDQRGNSLQEENNWCLGLAHQHFNPILRGQSSPQPMAYDGRYWVSFDGVILNAPSVRSQLSNYGHRFKTDSAAEIILASYAQWGIDCFQKLRGVWALVLADFERQEVVLCRDRFGVKPLYYAYAQQAICVVSEIKQLKAALNFSPNDKAIVNYLLGNPDLPDETFFDGILPVPPGHSITISLNGLVPSEPRSYWSPTFSEGPVEDIQEAALRFRSLLIASTELNLRTSPNWACELSGSLSSSTVAACVNALSRSAIETFSVTYPGHPMDKSDDIHKIIQSFGASPRYMTPKADHVASRFDQFVFAQDEPVYSVRQYISYELARVVQQSGHSYFYQGIGGDEIFSSLWEDYFTYLGGEFRAGKVVGVVVDLLGASLVDGNHELLWQLPGYLRRRIFGKPPSVFGQKNLNALNPTESTDTSMSFWERRVFQLLHQSLPGLLRSTDRNHMAFSIEPRFPFLDHTIAEYCLRFSPPLLYRNGWTHNTLRVAFEELLPQDFTVRRHETARDRVQTEWIFKALNAPVTAMLADQAAPVWAFVSPSKVKKLARQVFGRPEINTELSECLFRVFNLNRWMSVFELSR